MRKSTSFLLIFLLSTISAYSQIIITGTIKDDKGSPLSGVQIIIPKLDKATTTNEAGLYTISDIPNGIYSIKVSKAGYSPTSKDMNLSENTTVNFELKDKSLEIKAIEITEEKKYYQKHYNKKEASPSLRLQTPLLNTAQNIQVITSDALADQQIMGITDGVLKNVSGASLSGQNIDIYASISMRGSQATSFMNGSNISYPHGPLSSDMSYVERIEFVKGPAGFMMSYGDPAGIYNLVTKKPKFLDKKITGHIRSTIGSFGLYRGEGDVNVSISDKVAFRLNLMGKKAKSFRNYSFNDRYVVAPSLAFKLSEKTLLTTEYIYQKAIMSNTLDSYIYSNKKFKEFPRELSMSDPGIQPTVANNHYTNVNLSHELSDNWKLTSQLSYIKHDQFAVTTAASTVSDKGLIKRSAYIWDAEVDMILGQVFLNGYAKTGSISHTILTGLDAGNKKYLDGIGFLKDLDKENELFDPYNPVYGKPSNGYPEFDNLKPLHERAAVWGTSDLYYTGLYFQDEIGFIEKKLRLTLAGRLTDVSKLTSGKRKNTSKFTPRLGLSVSITEDFSAYSIYDQTFTPQTGNIKDGTEVKPVTGTNIEVGLKKDWFEGIFNTTLSLYQITKRNELIGDPHNAPGELFSVVKGESVAKGIEVDTKGELFKGANIIVNYAYTNHEITKSNVPLLKVGDKVPNYATHNFNTWLNYQIQEGTVKGLGASLGYTFLGDRTLFSISKEDKWKMDDYSKIDACLFWNNDIMTIRLNVYNIADEYLYTGSIMRSKNHYYQAEAPRNYRVSVTYKF